MAQSEVHNLTSLLNVLQRKVEEDEANGEADKHITVREIFELVGRRAYGPLLLIIGLISISPLTVVPGSTWAFAALTLLVALQLAFHKRTPWMPAALLKLKLSQGALGAFTRKARPAASTVDRVVQPRLQFLADPPWVFGVASLCMVAAILTFPLGLIPIAPIAPGLAITLFGLGLTARDGILLLAGVAAIGGGLLLVSARLF